MTLKIPARFILGHQILTAKSSVFNVVVGNIQELTFLQCHRYVRVVIVVVGGGGDGDLFIRLLVLTFFLQCTPRM